ncbi:type II secretion system F family protein [Desulfovibrio inopinatus]|uniref:type II secretion system F family protein n=1 Tax=Desulfovibrio inopinatus TaxID=102109 RepID=UPI000422EB0B|nr:type II secretion system F family protein [Desulfovibrio inopinatus]
MKPFISLLVAIAVFSALFYLLFAVFSLVMRRITQKEAKAFQNRLATVRGEHIQETEIDITKKQQHSAIPWFDVVLSRLHWSKELEKSMEQADMKTPLGVFILLSLLLGVTSYLFGLGFSDSALVPPVAGLGGVLMPFFWLRRKKKSRANRFEKQLPEALDLVARALRAGHTFTSGMAMVGKEFDDPIKTEFGRTLEEINIGANPQEALDNLEQRVDSPDLTFFVISVKIQSETGGNLSEVIESIAHTIRERFKLRGRVDALAAEGKLSAIVLVLLPFGVAFAINLLNPDYLATLQGEWLGKVMLYMAGSLMFMGIVVIKKMINIKV